MNKFTNIMVLFSVAASTLGTPAGIALIIFGSVFVNSTIFVAVGVTILIFATLNTLIFLILLCHSFDDEAKAHIKAV